MAFFTGQRITSYLGTGTILGFEHFTKDGHEAKPFSQIDTGGRAIVRLDNPENWTATLLTPNPYISQGELTELIE